jgi:hypothetical protein
VNCFGRVIRYFCLAACFLGLSKSLLASRNGESRLPLSFEQNLGQAPKDVLYLMRGGALQGAFESNGVRLKLKTSPRDTEQVVMRLVGAREDAAVKGGGLMEGRSNYLVGNDSARWLRGVPNYAEVRYNEIYPGTDLLFYGNDGSLEHDFELMPGADPARIAFRLDGSKKLMVASNGDLEIELVAGQIRFEKPVAYQTIDGSRRLVDAAFQLEADGSIHFRLGKYDPAAKLIIDPVLSFATYLSTYSEDVSLIAIDAAGNNYLSGVASLGFPVTSGAFPCPDCASSDGVVTFISKLSPDGTKLLYSTVLGGDHFAQPTGMVLDAKGDVLVSGITSATDFPTKNGQPINMSSDIFGYLVSLSADGSTLNYGTLLGSKPSTSNVPATYADAVAVDSSGNAYVAGIGGSDFNVTPGALNQIRAGYSGNSFDVFLAKFGPTGTLLYSALLGTADPQNGGDGPIGAEAVAVDASGNAYVAGQAGILWPISSNAYLKQIAGSMPYATPFVMKVAPDAKTQVYSTYLDYAYIVTGIALLENGNLFVAGDEVGANFPTTANAYQASTDNASFLTELNTDGSGLVYSTTVGDATYRINGMALDPNGNIWLAGQTSSDAFPLVDPIQGTFPFNSIYLNGPASVVDQFDPTGQQLQFSTFLGGGAPGYASQIAVGTDHKAHVAGAAAYGMYTTANTYLGSVPVPGPGYSGATYAYVAEIDPTVASGTVCLDPASGGINFIVPVGTTGSQSLQLTNCGGASLTLNSITSSNAAFSVPSASNACIGTLAVGASCGFTVSFTPAAAQGYSGAITMQSNGTVDISSIPATGTGYPTASVASSVTAVAAASTIANTQTDAVSITVAGQSGQSAPTGTVTLSSGNFSAQQALSGAAASITIPAGKLSSGANTITVTYSGDAVYTGSNSTLTITVASLTLSAPAPTPVSPGGNATTTISLSAGSSYSGTLNLSCALATSPANAQSAPTCSLNPSSVSITAGGSAMATMTVKTTAAINAALAAQSSLRLLGMGGGGTILAGLLWLGIPARRRRWFALAVLAYLFGAAGILTGCGGGGSSGTGPTPPGTPATTAGTYTFTVTGTDSADSAITSAISVKVVVQ